MNAFELRSVWQKEQPCLAFPFGLQNLGSIINPFPGIKMSVVQSIKSFMCLFFFALLRCWGVFGTLVLAFVP